MPRTGASSPGAKAKTSPQRQGQGQSSRTLPQPEGERAGRASGERVSGRPPPPPPLQQKGVTWSQGLRAASTPQRAASKGKASLAKGAQSVQVPGARVTRSRGPVSTPPPPARRRKRALNKGKGKAGTEPAKTSGKGTLAEVAHAQDGKVEDELSIGDRLHLDTIAFHIIECIILRYQQPPDGSNPRWGAEMSDEESANYVLQQLAVLDRSPLFHRALAHPTTLAWPTLRRLQVCAFLNYLHHAESSSADSVLFLEGALDIFHTCFHGLREDTAFDDISMDLKTQILIANEDRGINELQLRRDFFRVHGREELTASAYGLIQRRLSERWTQLYRVVTSPQSLSEAFPFAAMLDSIERFFGKLMLPINDQYPPSLLYARLQQLQASAERRGTMSSSAARQPGEDAGGEGRDATAHVAPTQQGSGDQGNPPTPDPIAGLLMGTPGSGEERPVRGRRRLGSRGGAFPASALKPLVYLRFPADEEEVQVASSGGRRAEGAGRAGSPAPERPALAASPGRSVTVTIASPRSGHGLLDYRLSTPDPGACTRYGDATPPQMRGEVVVDSQLPLGEALALGDSVSDLDEDEDPLPLKRPRPLRSELLQRDGDQFPPRSRGKAPTRIARSPSPPAPAHAPVLPVSRGAASRRPIAGRSRSPSPPRPLQPEDVPIVRPPAPSRLFQPTSRFQRNDSLLGPPPHKHIDSPAAPLIRPRLASAFNPVVKKAPWTMLEYSALLDGLEECGEDYSRILAMHGPTGTGLIHDCTLEELALACRAVQRGVAPVL